MAYYLNLFSPETYETFSQSSMNLSGFRKRHQNAASKVSIGDKFICYMTKLSRWIGVLEVRSEAFHDETPFYYEADDPFVTRFQVKPIGWLKPENGIPIHEDFVWKTLSFTKLHDHNSYQWTGHIRTSLVKLSEQDGQFLESIILNQLHEGMVYPLDSELYEKLASHRIRRKDKTVTVSVPTESNEVEIPSLEQTQEVRESIQIQALLARIGAIMGMNIWIPRNDRQAVRANLGEFEHALLEILPLNYDETTLKTIEQIDVIWLKGRSIIRAFEVEHTTSIYSGILRMADLLALQPNMDIRLHIVAPEHRKAKVFDEIRRPVFSLLEKGPLSENCTYLSYDSLRELAKQRHLNRMNPDVLDDYAEEVE